MVPAPAPEVSSVPFMPSPAILPELACHASGCSCALSGLVQVQLMVDGAPARTVLGFAEHDMIGGFFGGSFTAKFELQLASPSFFLLGSDTRAVTV
jgi:hypothetical protein